MYTLYHKDINLSIIKLWITIDNVIQICYTIDMKENRTEFIIIRVTIEEKKTLKEEAKSLAKRFSGFIRSKLGLK